MNLPEFNGSVDDTLNLEGLACADDDTGLKVPEQSSPGQVR